MLLNVYRKRPQTKAPRQAGRKTKDFMKYAVV